MLDSADECHDFGAGVSPICAKKTFADAEEGGDGTKVWTRLGGKRWERW
jgi:hypothetical protein